MIDISTRRWHVKTDPNGAGVFIRDMNAPFHLHGPVQYSDLPTVNQMALMSEDDFDSVMHKLAYEES